MLLFLFVFIAIGEYEDLRKENKKTKEEVGTHFDMTWYFHNVYYLLIFMDLLAEYFVFYLKLMRFFLPSNGIHIKDHLQYFNTILTINIYS